jgi:hypothetical protein
VAAFRFVIPLILTSNAFALTAIFPLKDVRAGQHGIGKTVFSGNKIEEFQVEVLGILENLGPKQSVILARLSGGEIEKTGIIQGMSGSPVYIDGRLVGAVALGFPFSKDAIAGIRPIEDMLALAETPAAPKRTAVLARLSDLRSLPSPAALWNPALHQPLKSEMGDMIDIATPLSFGGFTSGTIEQFGVEMKKFGLEPRQGVSSGGHLPPQLGDPSLLKPGDMISVQLLSGDLSIGADGTVTAIDGNRLFAFGHRFLAVGGTELPFARADVITTLANLSSSFKISSAREWMGTITEDRSTSVFGELGRRAATVPLEIELSGSRHAPLHYNMQMVNDRVLSPFILQLAVFNAIDATERTLGMGTFIMHGEVDFQQAIPPLKLDNTYAGDFGVPLSASLGVASPLAYIMGSGFDSLKVKNIKLSIEASEKKHVLQVDQVAVSKKEIHPGDTIELAVTLAGENGAEILKTVRYQVPIGASTGPLEFTVADAMTANLTEFQQLLGTQPKSPSQVVSFLNGLRPNTNAYIRVWRADTAFEVQGTDLPDPPPSVALLLAKSQATPQNTWVGRGSTIAQMQIGTGDAVVTGSKTVQVEVKE